VHRLFKQQREHCRTHVAARATTAAAPVATAEAGTERPEPTGTKATAEPAGAKAAAWTGPEPAGPTRETAAATETAGAVGAKTTPMRPLVAVLIPVSTVMSTVAPLMSALMVAMSATMHFFFLTIPVSPPLARHPAHRLNEGRLGPLVAESPGARTHSTIC
jgi:hypothetical protein